MTRQECEAKLLSLAEQMRAVYMAYNPAGDFMTVIMEADGFICVNDAFFTRDQQIVRDVHGDIFKTVSVTKYADGHISGAVHSTT